jgi:aminoglycoside phosphotransferase (APT) family kinase protein
MEHHPQDQQLQAIVQRLMPGSKFMDAQAMQGGISARMTLLKFETPVGDVKRVIVRQPDQGSFQENQHPASYEYRLLKLLHSRGLVVPEPFLFLDSEEDIGLSPCLIVEYIPGHLVFVTTNKTYYILQMAFSLAHIHSMDVSGPEYSFLYRRSIGCREMAIGNMKMDDYAIDVTQVYDRLPSATVAAHSGHLCLLHGDFWPGNLIWRDGSLVGIIDWEDACLGEPLIDLSISRLDICCIFGEEAMGDFTQQYITQTHIDTTDLPYWDLCAVMRMARLIGTDLTDWAAYYPRIGREDITGDTIKESCRIFIDQALSKLK